MIYKDKGRERGFQCSPKTIGKPPMFRHYFIVKFEVLLVSRNMICIGKLKRAFFSCPSQLQASDILIGWMQKLKVILNLFFICFFNTKNSVRLNQFHVYFLSWQLLI